MDTSMPRLLLALAFGIQPAQLETTWPSCSTQVHLGAYQVCVRAVAWVPVAECPQAGDGACLAVRLTVRKTASDDGCSSIAVHVGVDPAVPPEPACVYGGFDIRWQAGQIRTIDYRFSLPARGPAASLVLRSRTWGHCTPGLRFGIPTADLAEIPLEGLE
jgi:hypothetical protein